MELDINDINLATQAIRLAQSRGAFQMEETAQLLNSIIRLEEFYSTQQANQERMESLASEETVQDEEK